MLLKLKNTLFNYVEKICNFVDFYFKYYTKRYMFDTNTFQADVTLPTQFQNKVVTNITT